MIRIIFVPTVNVAISTVDNPVVPYAENTTNIASWKLIDVFNPTHSEGEEEFCPT
jgi:hypothetical protein